MAERRTGCVFLHQLGENGGLLELRQVLLAGFRLTVIQTKLETPGPGPPIVASVVGP